MIEEIVKKDLADVVQAVKSGEITAEELCEYYLNRIISEGMKGKLNCVYSINENAIRDAREIDASDKTSLPLCGLMVLVKDNIDVEGMATTAGSIALLDNIAKEDADVIKRLKSKGAIILGKTNLTEFANCLTQGMPNGYSSAGGQVISKYGPDKDPGGSSSGSGVAMSAGLCSFAVGTDTSFSVIACASGNGVVGFKPAVGKMSIKGIVPITMHLDSAGFFTKSVRDMVFLYEGVFGGKIANIELGKRLLINDFNRDIVAEEQLEHYDRELAVLTENGVVTDHIPGENTSKLKELMLRCFARELKDYLVSHGSSLSIEDIINVYKEDMDKNAPYGVSNLEQSNEYMHSDDNDAEIEAILADRKTKREQVLAELEGFDACLMTGPTCLMHYTGMTSVSVPFVVEPKDGIPRNMILYNADEKKLLAVARLIEEHSLM